MPTLYINTDAVSLHVQRLAKISCSALPVVVRQTLNSAAYDVKKNTMPETAKQFIYRKPTFFAANSGVKQAQGFDINSMHADVGFKPKENDSSHSVEDLQEQEDGGSIKGRAFVPLAGARVAGSWGMMVRPENRMANIRGNFWDSNNSNLTSKSAKERFIISALFAKAYGGVVLGNETFKNGNRHLYRVTGVIRVQGDTHVSLQLIDTVKKGGEAHVKATHFMKDASLTSATKMERTFIQLADKKINKIP